MNCSQVKEQLHPFADGELPPEEMAAVQAALADCLDCELELKELEATSLFAREAFTAPVADVDLSGVFGGVMARIAAEDAAEAAAAAPSPTTDPEAPGLWERFTSWLSDAVRFEQPLQSLGAMAAVILVVGGIYSIAGPADTGSTSPPNDGITAPVVADGADDGAKKNAPRRRGMEQEQEMVRSNGAAVESYEVAEGQLIIEGGADDAPVVVWHVDNDEGDGTDGKAPAPSTK